MIKSVGKQIDRRHVNIVKLPEPVPKKLGIWQVIKTTYIKDSVLIKLTIVQTIFATLLVLFNAITYCLTPEDVFRKGILSFHGCWSGSLVVLAGILLIHFVKCNYTSATWKIVHVSFVILVWLASFSSSLWLYGIMTSLMIRYKQNVLYENNLVRAFSVECLVFACLCLVVICYVILVSMIIKYYLCNEPPKLQKKKSLSKTNPSSKPSNLQKNKLSQMAKNTSKPKTNLKRWKPLTLTKTKTTSKPTKLPDVKLIQKTENTSKPTDLKIIKSFENNAPDITSKPTKLPDVKLIQKTENTSKPTDLKIIKSFENNAPDITSKPTKENIFLKKTENSSNLYENIPVDYAKPTKLQQNKLTKPETTSIIYAKPLKLQQNELLPKTEGTSINYSNPIKQNKELTKTEHTSINYAKPTKQQNKLPKTQNISTIYAKPTKQQNKLLTKTENTSIMYAKPAKLQQNELLSKTESTSNKNAKSTNQTKLTKPESTSITYAKPTKLQHNKISTKTERTSTNYAKPSDLHKKILAEILNKSKATSSPIKPAALPENTFDDESLIGSDAESVFY